MWLSCKTPNLDDKVRSILLVKPLFWAGESESVGYRQRMRRIKNE